MRSKGCQGCCCWFYSLDPAVAAQQSTRKGKQVHTSFNDGGAPRNTGGVGCVQALSSFLCCTLPVAGTWWLSCTWSLPSSVLLTVQSTATPLAPSLPSFCSASCSDKLCCVKPCGMLLLLLTRHCPLIYGTATVGKSYLHVFQSWPMERVFLNTS